MMTTTLEYVGVAVIVGAAVFWAGRSLWRSARKKQVCSTCGQAGACPLVGQDDAASAPGESCGAVPEFARPPE